MDSVSVSTNPAMGGSTDTGMTSSDSTDIRMPMTDSSNSAGAATGQVRGCIPVAESPRQCVT